MSKNTNLSFLTDYITADIVNGRIGINNASPTVAFDVTGSARVSGAATFSSSVTATQLLIKDSSADNPTTLALFEGAQSGRGLQIGLTTDSLGATGAAVTYNARTSGGYGGHIWQNGGSAKMTLTSAGNVGIGTGTPTKLLSVYEGTSTTVHSIKMGNATSPTNGYVGMWYGQLRITNGTTYNTTSGWVADGAYAPTEIYMSASSNDGFITFSTANSNVATPTERMRITSAGNVGIGTSSPSQKLDVNGTIRAAGAFVQATGNIFVGDWVGFYDVSTSTSKVYLLQFVPTETIPLLNYRLFGVIQTNTVSGSYYFTSIASQTMEVRFVGNTIQTRITNGQSGYFNWSITQLC